ncbi:hypothetical protein GN958_ATG21630 [Phytophthora infestans]|uniref:Uncharacterized protein n=1 Tax=Phytophthora infestans TaxID=4787 RepID=A0A8S9TJV2_PHYIN|nr:hypothetical protein GN958_ATG21630 [Phytophthora infestans]
MNLFFADFLLEERTNFATVESGIAAVLYHGLTLCSSTTFESNGSLAFLANDICESVAPPNEETQKAA